MSHEPRFFVGIDFGTTASAIVHAAPDGTGGYSPIAMRGGEDAAKIPSAVYITQEGRYLVGEDAVKAGDLDPTRFYSGFKLHLDRENDTLRAHPEIGAVSARALTKVIIERLLERARDGGIEVVRPAITHPAGDPWAQIMLSILENMGISAALSLSEPVAALYQAHHEHRIFDDRDQNVLLIDFGGGTCDFALMTVRGFKFRGLLRPSARIADEDRLRLGGRDLDRIVAEELVGRWRAQHPRLAHLPSPLETPIPGSTILRESKAAKEALSRQYAQGKHDASLPILIQGLPRGSGIQTVLTALEVRELLIAEIKPRFNYLLNVDDATTAHRGLLDRNGMGPYSITTVILTGGSSRLPWLEDDVLRPMFPPRTRFISLREPELSVAYGAALYMADQSERRARLPRHTEEDLKIELADGSTYTLVKRATPLPLRPGLAAFHTFQYPASGRYLTVSLITGSSHRADDCRRLSSEPRTVEFDHSIAEGTAMTLRVEVDREGGVELRFSTVGLSPTTAGPLYFNPLKTGWGRPQAREVADVIH